MVEDGRGGGAEGKGVCVDGDSGEVHVEPACNHREKPLVIMTGDY